MRGTTRTMAVAGVSALALLTAACSGDSADPSTSAGASGSASAGAAGGSIVVNGCTPENPLIASNTGETCGGNVLDTITSKLVH